MHHAHLRLRLILCVEFLLTASVNILFIRGERRVKIALELLALNKVRIHLKRYYLNSILNRRRLFARHVSVLGARIGVHLHLLDW